MRHLGVTSTVALFWLLGCSVAQSAAPTIESCIGSYKVRIVQQNVATCKKYTKSKKVKAEQKAKIFLQLGIFEMFNGGSSANFDAGAQEAKVESFMREAMKLDPNYPDSSLSLAGYFMRIGQKSKALEILRKAILQFPDDPRFAADLATVIADPAAAEEVRKLCEKSLSHKAADYTSFRSCASAYWNSGLVAEGEATYRKAIGNFEHMTFDRFVIPGDPRVMLEFVFKLDRIGRTQDAITFHEDYLIKHPKYSSFYDEDIAVARMYEKLSLYLKAARAFEKASRRTGGNDQAEVRIKQIENLVAAGEFAEAKLVSERFFERASKRSILQLQVKLKNGTQKQIKITGVFDAETKKALEVCLADRGCFPAHQGQSL